jgi:hypothetical protein
MPILPENRKLYPPDWKAISHGIRFVRAQGRCEWCDAAHGEPHPVTGSKVVLTTAHYPDHNPANCKPDNLHALCQRCHNKADAPVRAANKRARKAKT